MTAVRNSAARTADRDRAEPRPAIVQPGHNCWRVDRADRFRCIQDAADYFRWTREALLRARHSIFIVGWDIQANLDLLPGADPAVTTPPTRLDALLAFVVRRRPQLRCYVLIWDHAALYTLERDPLSRWRLGWRMPRQVRFGFDDHHPVGGSHHQKIVVVDDAVAFCGGVDLTGHRWDTSAHRIEEPARATAIGTPYGPYHEVQAMLSGPAAASLGALVRDRWRALGEEPRQPQVGAIDASVARRRRARSVRRRRGHRAHDAGLRTATRRPGVRAAVPRLDRGGGARDLHREPVLHQRRAECGPGRPPSRARRTRSDRRRAEGTARAGSSARRWARCATACSAT